MKNDITLLEPAFPETDRCIVFAANAGYMPLTSVAVKSIIDTRAMDEVYDIIILHRGVPQTIQDAFCSMDAGIENVSIRFYDMEEFVKSTSFYVDNRPTLSAETYYRLYIPWLLSHSYRAALYLDGDMMITRNINQIFDCEYESYEIAAVRDFWGISNCYMPGDNRRKYRESIGLTDIDNYIIAGTILFNLDRFRNAHSLSQVQQVIQKQKWMQHDQDVINFLCQHAILHISPDWGMMDDYGNFHYLPQYMQNELAGVDYVPAVIHYGGDRKPYSYTAVPQEEVFWGTADRTPFFRELLNKITVPKYKYQVIQRLAANHSEGYISVSDAKIYYHGILVGPSAGDLHYRSVRVDQNRLHIEVWCGQHDLSEEKMPELCLKVNDQYVNPIDSVREDLFCGADHFRYALGQLFHFEFPLNMSGNSTITIEPRITINGTIYPCTEVWYEQTSAVHQEYKSAYYVSDGWCITSAGTGLTVVRCSALGHIRKELRFFREIWKLEGIAGKKAVLVRTLLRLIKSVVRKPVCLVYDAHYQEGCAAESVFRYLATHNSNSVTPVLAVGECSSDLSELQVYGRVIPALTHNHKLMVLLSDCMVVDDLEEMMFDLFEKRYDLYRDLTANTPTIKLGIIHAGDERSCRSAFELLKSRG